MRTVGLRFRTKVILHTTLAALVALGLATVGFVTNDQFRLRGALVNELHAAARHIGPACMAAIRFDDPETATEQLALVHANPHVLAAAVYGEQGQLFACYPPAAADPRLPSMPDEVEHIFADRHLWLLYPLLSDGLRIGAISIERDLTDVTARLWRYVGIVIAVLAASLVVAVLTTSYFQRTLTRPIQELVTLAGAVSERQDYALRARRATSDELGVLCDAFNSMLAQIQSRDAELAKHRAHLEQLVRERTHRLETKTLALRDSERRLARINAELARSNSELEQFAYIASHDLQEPLRKVQAFGDMLASRFRDALGEEGQDYLQRMQNASARMKTLINDLLTYSRVTTKAQPFREVDLAVIAQEVASDLETRLRETGGRLEIGPLPKLDAEPTQMRQLLQNLIGNALKYHPRDVAPVVKVGSRVLDQPQDAASGGGSGDQICELSVQDNGIGFEEKYLDRIFSPFVRLHGRSEYEGTGMGLAVCRKIVERHGGSITASSRPGEGSTFLVTLPLKQHTKEPAEAGELPNGDAGD